VDLNPHNYTHLIFTKVAKEKNKGTKGEKTASSINVVGKNGYPSAQN
jgi:hypothetical protein